MYLSRLGRLSVFEHSEKTLGDCRVVTNRLERDLFTDARLLPEPDAKVIYARCEGGIHDRECCVEYLIFLESLSCLLSERMNGIEKSNVPPVGGARGIKGNGEKGRRAFQPSFPFA